MNALTTFNFEGASVRTVTGDDGEPLFVGNDVCAVLGYANASDAMSKHCKGVAKRYPLQTLGGEQELRVLSEADVLRLIVRSRLPAAEAFERWVFEEVLPTIRKTGSYGVAPAADPMAVLNDPAAMRGLLLCYTEKVLALEGQVADLGPKAEALDRIATHGDGSLRMRDAAAALQMAERKFHSWLHEIDFIYRAADGDWHAYAAPRKALLLEHKLHPYIDSKDGETKYRTQVRVTAKGMAKLAEMLERRATPA